MREREAETKREIEKREGGRERDTHTHRNRERQTIRHGAKDRMVDKAKQSDCWKVNLMHKELEIKTD